MKPNTEPLPMIAEHQLPLWAGLLPAAPRRRVTGRGARQLADFLQEHPDVIGRYWAKVWTVSTRGCWFWTGALNGRTGHAKVHLGYDAGVPWVEYGHRIAWVLHGGILSIDTVVRHTCDEASCQQPAHLVEGTSADNSHDWSTRRGDQRGPLADSRGAFGRARAIQHAIANSRGLSGDEQISVVAATANRGIAAAQLGWDLTGKGLKPEVTDGQGQFW